MKKITLRTIDWTIIVLNIFCVIMPLFFIVLIANEIHNSSIQTVFIITSLSILGIFNFILIKKKSYLVDVYLYDEKIEIKRDDLLIYSSNYNDIISYNHYFFINKRGGYILRLRSKSSSYCSLMTWTNFERAVDSDYENYNYVKKELSLKAPNKKIMESMDYLLKLISISPYIALILALIALIGIIIYITSI